MKQTEAPANWLLSKHIDSSNQIPVQDLIDIVGRINYNLREKIYKNIFLQDIDLLTFKSNGDQHLVDFMGVNLVDTDNGESERLCDEDNDIEEPIEDYIQRMIKKIIGDLWFSLGDGFSEENG